MNVHTRRVIPLAPHFLLVLRLLVVAAVLAGVSPTAAPAASDRVVIRVWPMTSMAPTSFLIRVLIERNATNRWIKVTAESDAYFASSEGQLEGERSSRLRIVQFRDVPAGTYELRAVVLDMNGEVTGSAQTSATVIGR